MAFSRWKQQLRGDYEAIKASRAGERFQDFYRRKHRAERSRLSRWLGPVFALLSFAIGVVLVFVPGPAVVFFALTAALLAAESRAVARALDRAELRLRDVWAKLKALRARHRRSHARAR
jgi:multisubunit Na+/H+ antiporter MnhG subunit